MAFNAPGTEVAPPLPTTAAGVGRSNVNVCCFSQRKSRRHKGALNLLLSNEKIKPVASAGRGKHSSLPVISDLRPNRVVPTPAS